MEFPDFSLTLKMSLSKTRCQRDIVASLKNNFSILEEQTEITIADLNKAMEEAGQTIPWI